MRRTYLLVKEVKLQDVLVNVTEVFSHDVPLPRQLVQLFGLILKSGLALVILLSWDQLMQIKYFM
jgi:hypothetical protein